MPMGVDYCYLCMSHKVDNGHCPGCGAATEYEAPVHHLKPGTILREKYLIGKAIGEGGFGITYVGRDLTLDMKIAVKEYYPNGVSNRNNDHSNEVTLAKGHNGNDFEKEMQRFLSEARILARFCNDPGVVGVRDFFRDNGTAYIVMEYLDGITLKNYLKKFGPIPAETFAEMIEPILLALYEIHNQGLIHRDISPDNIMMLKNGRLKLLDFGAAREVAGDKSLSVVLKPGYAPEEQYRSKGQQGSWTDVYAMCATIYKCITGITPDESIQRVFEDELKKPSELGVAIPAKIEQALMQGLSVKSNDRIQTMDVLHRAICRDANENLRSVQFQRIDMVSNAEASQLNRPKNQERTVHHSDDRTEYRPTVTEQTAQQESTEYSAATEDVDTQTVAITAEQSAVTYVDDDKTEYRPTPTEQTAQQESTEHSAETENPDTRTVAITPEQPDTPAPEATKADQPVIAPATSDKPALQAEQVARTTAEDKPMVTPEAAMVSVTADKTKKKKMLLIAGICAVAIVSLCIVLILSTGKSGRKSIADYLPSERIMAQDVSTVLKKRNVPGSVLNVEVKDENLNEKFKIYKVRCEITIADGTEKIQYQAELTYEFSNEAWELSSYSVEK